MAVKQSRQNPAWLVYGVPALIVLIATIYLMVAPVPEQTFDHSYDDSNEQAMAESRDESPELPLIIHYQYLDDPLCPPALQVVQDLTNHYRLLRCGSSIIAGQYSTMPVSIFTTDYVRASAGMIKFPKLKDQPEDQADYLLIGLNGGHVAKILANTFALTGDVIEQHPTIPQLAGDFFAYGSANQTIKHVLQDRVDRWIDSLGYDPETDACATQHAYGLISAHLIESQARITALSMFAQESIQAIKECALRTGGVLTYTLQVIHRNQGAHVALSVGRTLAKVFKNVEAFTDGTSDIGTLTFFASDRQINFQTKTLPRLPKVNASLTQEEAANDPFIEQRYEQRIWVNMLTKWRWNETNAAVNAEYPSTVINSTTLQHFVDWQTIVLKMHRMNNQNIFPSIFRAQLQEPPQVDQLVAEHEAALAAEDAQSNSK